VKCRDLIKEAIYDIVAPTERDCDNLKRDITGKRYKTMKVKALQFRVSKTDEALHKNDREACLRQKASIVSISKVVIELKENIEERKFSKGETEEQVAEWGREIEQDLSKTDDYIRMLTQKIKEIDSCEEEAKSVMIHKQNMMFEQELLQQKAQFEQNLKDEQNQANVNSKISGAKLPKLPITKFNGKFESWLPFWGKFSSEIDAANLSVLTKFSYLKELLEEPIRADIDGLPFTEEGYSKAKAILEAEYGQTSEVVNAYVQNIMGLPVISGANPKRIGEFYKQLRYNVQSLETMGKLADVKGNVRSTLEKLNGIKADLVRGTEGWQNWSFTDLLEQLKKWRDIHPTEDNIAEKQKSFKRSPFFHTRDVEHETSSRACVYCENTAHKSGDCTTVVSVDNRKKILAKKGRCFNCTGTQHQAAHCKSKSRCRKCNRKHHTSICTETPPAEQLLTAQHGNKNTIVYPVVIVDVEGVKCRALLDTGAGSSYASAALIDRLPRRECKRETRKVEMMLGTTTREMELRTVNVKASSGQFEMAVEVAKVEKGELVLLENPQYQQLIKNYPHLEGVAMEDTDAKEQLPVHIILGASEYAKVKTTTPPKIGTSGQPIAELTRLGWTIISPGKECFNETQILLTQTSRVEYEELCRQDVLGLQDKATEDQSGVYDEFKEQLVRSEEAWYETGLPWRGNHPPLPNNRNGSLRRLRSLTRKLESQHLATQYKEIIDEQREVGIVEPADQPAIGTEFFIPHKPVVRPNAESTKIRVVYNASARAYEGAPSLNECLHTGPPLQNKLWNVLVRSRFYPVALSGDIQKAFLQVRIRANDRDALRFHWQESGKSEVETLRFTRALFGLTTSPFLLGGVIEAHLSTWEDREPETFAKLKRELYVDDLISGSTTVQGASELKAKASDIFGDACFQLHKWHSNARELESNQDPAAEPTYAKQHLQKPDGGASSLLGLNWDKNSDTLSVTFPQEEAVATKRGVLTKLAKIYDPLGIASPATLSGKLLYRAACDSKKPWDDPIP
jgi:hypothetical protein